MARTLDFWFDYSCPYAYVGSERIESVARAVDASLSWRPMLLGGVFAAQNTPQNLASTLGPAKAAHNLADMHRQAAEAGVPFHMPASHPMRTVEALRATLLADCDPAVIHGFYRAYWEEGRPVSDPAVIRDVLTRAGREADTVLARLGETSVKDDLRRRTDEAIARGVFGAPAIVVDGESLYWGADRLVLVQAEGRPATFEPPTDAARGHVLEVFWDFSSPFSYLGLTQARALADRTGITLVYRPMLLGGLFRLVGQVDLPMSTFSAAKQAYYAQDMSRWAAYWGVDFQWPSRFPMNTVKALRCWLALPEHRQEDFLRRAYHAFWAEDRDISDAAVLASLLGPDADIVLARTQDEDVKNALHAATRYAAEKGVFGAPTWLLDGEHLYWGQDRIPMLERTLRSLGGRS